ncbi:MAG TPA: tRNA (adenosine(37)-N6)-threonylcarbamoyltransferase complex transferase subunit TsaD [Bryobacteraceae bacterium]|nr:tRNA (adenosine(37)-N6)-threonylcarbamoyltransferase complex transferase subunit TsaD [Bryobacteraceae bacterium]
MEVKFGNLQGTPRYNNKLLILGIESSCDETAAAVLADGPRVISSVVASQLDTHAKYGGVVPELASREHLRAIVPVVAEAMERAGARYADLSAVAVTEGPGLVGSLLVGMTFAKSLAMALGLPLIAVNHLEGHIHAVVMEARGEGHEIELPAVALVVSGGHTHLFAVKPGYRYELLGRTRDDAAGEAYDKVAKLLGFSYPGGPVIDMLAPFGDPGVVAFTFAKMKGNALDFSFSGMKTAVLRWFESRGMESEVAARRALLKHTPRPAVDDWLTVTPKATLDLLASFQSAVVRELTRRAAEAIEVSGARALIVSGGVASNRALRTAATERTFGCPVYFPTPSLSTDNAAMIAAAAFPKFERREFAGMDLRAKAGLTLA